jgi:hypothetical protein
MRYRSRVYFETSSKERIHPRHEIEMENSFAEAKDLQDVCEQKIIFRIQYSGKSGENATEQVRHDGERASRHLQRNELIHVMKS